MNLINNIKIFRLLAITIITLTILFTVYYSIIIFISNEMVMRYHKENEFFASQASIKYENLIEKLENHISSNDHKKENIVADKIFFEIANYFPPADKSKEVQSWKNAKHTRKRAMIALKWARLAEESVAQQAKYHEAARRSHAKKAFWPWNRARTEAEKGTEAE